MYRTPPRQLPVQQGGGVAAPIGLRLAQTLGAGRGGVPFDRIAHIPNSLRIRSFEKVSCTARRRGARSFPVVWHKAPRGARRSAVGQGKCKVGQSGLRQ